MVLFHYRLPFTNVSLDIRITIYINLIMPRISIRQKLLKSLQNAISTIQKSIQLQHILKDNDSNSDNEDDNSTNTIGMQELYLENLQQRYETVQNTRYLFRKNTYRRGYKEEVYQRHFTLLDDEEKSWLNEVEFKEAYRMSRSAFTKLVDSIKIHPVFYNPLNTKKQASVEFQLGVFLYYLGRSGSGSSNPVLRNQFGISRGAAHLYKCRCVIAIRTLKNKYVRWPDINERKEIAARIYAKYNIPNCIAVADGTLLPLMTAPQTDDAPAYHGRKFLYSMSVMIVNDDQKKLGITFRVFQDALMIKEYMRVLPCSKKQNKNLKMRKRQNIF